MRDEYRDLGVHARRVIAGAILGSPQVLAVVAAALEGMGEEIGEETRIELVIDSARARVREGPDA
jgi:hypothetical protein